MPKRHQLSRRKGARKPPGVVSVARPGKYGNPWSVKQCAASDALAGLWIVKLGHIVASGGFRSRLDALDRAVDLHRQWVARMAVDELDRRFGSLRGCDLACWCPLDRPCHADTLIEVANRPGVDRGPKPTPAGC